MDRKLMLNLCALAVLICFAVLAGMSAKAPKVSEAQRELWDEREIAEFQQEGLERDRMIKLAPMLAMVVIYGAIIFVIFVLPDFVHRATRSLYDSSEMVEVDPLHDARSLFAQGEYEGAIEAYRGVAEKSTGDRFPWVEMAKIQNAKLGNPDAAIATLREALGVFEWEIKDAAFMMFRVAELYEKEKADLEMTKDILEQVAEMFPETRHAANATHRLRELGAL